MPLVPVLLSGAAPAPPEAARALVREANARIERFRDQRLIPGFVPSDFELAWGALALIVRAHLAPGRALCEWGSGFGVVASLAAMLGYEACGIEVEAELVAEARQLAADFGLRPRFARGSFVPEGGEDLTDRVDQAEAAWLILDGGDGYEELGLGPDDFDVIYAYPWPGEERVVFDLFERYAAAGALLLTYHGQDGLRAHRKPMDTPLRRRRR